MQLLFYYDVKFVSGYTKYLKFKVLYANLFVYIQ